MGCVLVADHRRTPIAIGDADLPEHRVARERGVVATASHVALNRRALPRRPVLIVTDPKDEVVAVETAGVEVEVGRREQIEGAPVALGPLDEAAGVGKPTGRPDRRRIVPGQAVLLEDEPPVVGLLAGVDRARLSVVTLDLGPVEHAASPRPPERDLMAAGVEALAAPRVVGVPRVGGEHEHGTLSLRSGSHDESGVGNPSAVGPVVGAKGDQMKARPPRFVDRDLDRSRPTTPVRVGIGRGFVEDAGHLVDRPGDGPLTTPPLDDHVECRCVGGDVHRRSVTRRVRKRAAVGLDDVVKRLVVGAPLDAWLIHGAESGRRRCRRQPIAPSSRMKTGSSAVERSAS